MSEHPVSANPTEGPGYEVSDASVKIVVRFAAVLLAMVFIAMGLMAGLFRMFAGIADTEAPPLPERPVPGPRLQVNTFMDLEALKAREDAQLKTYGWVSQEDKVVRLPIAEAMKLIAAGERPVPAGAGAAAGEGNGE